MSRSPDNEKTMEADAIEVGIEAAADAVSALPQGERRWDRKEYMIAETAARAAIEKLRSLSR